MVITFETFSICSVFNSCVLKLTQDKNASGNSQIMSKKCNLLLSFGNDSSKLFYQSGIASCEQSDGDEKDNR
jgi:hypothetical protein